MSEKLPRLTAKQFEKVLTILDFQLVRQSGSHRIYRNPRGVRATVPFHAGKILHPKILKTFLVDASLTVQQLKEIL